MTDTALEIWCVVVVKSFTRAKSRLASVLDATARSTLAREMFVHVFSICEGQAGVRGVLVATDDDAVAKLAVEAGAHVVRDDGKQPLGEVIDRAFDHVAALGATHAIAVMSDLPELHPSDMLAVIDALQAHEMVIVPDRARLGTNLLAMRLSTRIASSFGRPDSFVAHVNRADEGHIRSTVLDRPGLAFDVDTAEDYATLKLSRP